MQYSIDIGYITSVWTDRYAEAAVICPAEKALIYCLENIGHSTARYPRLQLCGFPTGEHRGREQSTMFVTMKQLIDSVQSRSAVERSGSGRCNIVLFNH